MKLNLEIFYHQMQDHATSMVFRTASHAFNISGVRAYTPGSLLRNDTLYIGTADAFLHNQDQTSVCFNCGNYITFPDLDLFTLLNAALEVFRYFTDWEEQCFQLLEVHAPLEELLTIGEQILPYSMLVVDASQFIIGYSPSMAESVTMSVDNTYGNYSIPIEILQEFNQTHADSFRAQKTFLLPDDYFPTKSACHHIFVQNQRVGTLIVAYTEEPDLFYLSQIIEIFVPIIQKWFLLAKNDDSSANTTSLMAQTLDGKPDAYEKLNHYLYLFGWEPEHTKQLFIARSRSENIHFDSHLSRALNNETKGIFCIPYQKSLAILCNYSLTSQDRFHKQLKQLLQRSNYYAIASSIFTELSILSELYQQIGIASRNLNLEIGEIYPVTRSVIPLIVQTIDAHLRIPVIHPALEEIREHDLQKHTSYFETLYAYLKYERNHQLTADSLFVHRNTLFLRLRKIQELWNLDLDDPELRFHLLFSFYHLETLKRLAETKHQNPDEP